MDYMAIIDSTEESMKWHFLQLRGRQVMASIMGNCVSKSLHRESADEVRVSCAKQNNRSGVGSARAWLVHSQSWWRCCRSARWRMEGKSILFAMDTTILTTLQQWQWQHCNNDNDTPTTRPPSNQESISSSIRRPTCSSTLSRWRHWSHNQNAAPWWRSLLVEVWMSQGIMQLNWDVGRFKLREFCNHIFCFFSLHKHRFCLWHTMPDLWQTQHSIWLWWINHQTKIPFLSISLINTHSKCM